MKTRKFYAVAVYDSACNDENHEVGYYGKNDYSWVDNRLNGGADGILFNMTEDEATEVKKDFERVIKEKGLDWAIIQIEDMELPYAETMQDVADYYNECDILDTQALEGMIEDNGWGSDCAEEFGICHSDTQKVIVDDDGKAVVISL